jgi:hypothetical protein
VLLPQKQASHQISDLGNQAKMFSSTGDQQGASRDAQFCAAR